jgi:ribosomal protein L32
MDPSTNATRAKDDKTAVLLRCPTCGQWTPGVCAAPTGLHRTHDWTAWTTSPVGAKFRHRECSRCGTTQDTLLEYTEVS